MDNKKQLKNFLATFAAFLFILAIVIASAGAMNYGGALYTVCGILNLANLYPVIKWTAKRLRPKE
jgi:hypothetical protein